MVDYCCAVSCAIVATSLLVVVLCSSVPLSSPLLGYLIVRNFVEVGRNFWLLGFVLLHTMAIVLSFEL